MTTTATEYGLQQARVMPTLHTLFRRELRLAGGVVRGVQPGDTTRAAVVADHVDFLMRALHHHHTVEDELLWPPLLSRVPEELAPIVELMQSQHEVVEHLVEKINALLPELRHARQQAELADTLDELHGHLVEHLDAEEAHLLPIAAAHLEPHEWDAMAEKGREGVARKDMALAMGMYQYEGDPQVIAFMLSEAPPPVRFLVPRLSRRAFRKHALRIHGTATP